MNQYRHSVSNFKFICFYEYQKAVPAVGFLYLEKKRKNNPVSRELTSTSICLEVWKGEVNKSLIMLLNCFRSSPMKDSSEYYEMATEMNNAKRDWGNRIRTKMGRKKEENLNR